MSLLCYVSLELFSFNIFIANLSTSTLADDWIISKFICNKLQQKYDSFPFSTLLLWWTSNAHTCTRKRKPVIQRICSRGIQQRWNVIDFTELRLHSWNVLHFKLMMLNSKIDTQSYWSNFLTPNVHRQTKTRKMQKVTMTFSASH